MALTNPRPLRDRTTGKRSARANVTIVDADADSAEALEALIAAFPGVAGVRSVADPAAALRLLRPDVRAFDMSAPEVVDVVLIDPRSSTMDATQTLAWLREEAPDAVVVMLCLYPEQTLGAACSLADVCLPKDTTPADLRALLERLLGDPSSPGALER